MMTIKAIVDLVKNDSGGWVLIIVILMSLIQVSKIEINPWDFIFEWVGKHFHKDLTDEIVNLKDNVTQQGEKIDNLDRKIEENEMKSSRYRIIRFDDEMTRGITHSDDHIAQIVEDDIKTYEAYCDTHPDFINHKGESARKRILEKYEAKEVM